METMYYKVIQIDGDYAHLQRTDIATDDTISRDLLVPADMPLYALNYAIQKCFGWQNCHLHQFQFSGERSEELTGGTAGNWADLIGVVFRSPYMEEEEYFWNDDYEDDENFNTWLRKKYTGPYLSLCHGEGIWQCEKDSYLLEKRNRAMIVNWWVNDQGEKVYSFPTDLYDFHGKKLKNPQTPPETDWSGKPMLHQKMEFKDIPMQAG